LRSSKSSSTYIGEVRLARARVSRCKREALTDDQEIIVEEYRVDDGWCESPMTCHGVDSVSAVYPWIVIMCQHGR
jgi:hypothetical protein